MPIYRKGEFFNGPGGFAAGARMARVVDANGEEHKVEHTWSNEICPDAPQHIRIIFAQQLLIQ